MSFEGLQLEHCKVLASKRTFGYVSWKAQDNVCVLGVTVWARGFSGMKSFKMLFKVGVELKGLAKMREICRACCPQKDEQ